jgi:hypothetical protein
MKILKNKLLQEENDMEKGIIEKLVGVLVRPTSTIRSICEQRPIGWAVVIYLVVGLITTITMVDPGMLEKLRLPELGMTEILVGFTIINIVALVILTAICHVVASVLGGKGSYGGLFCGFGFAALPGIFAAPLAVVGLLPVVGALLSGPGSLGIMVWSIVLSILAVRENYLVSTGRAILIYFLPLAVLMMLVFLLVTLIFLV